MPRTQTDAQRIVKAMTAIGRGENDPRPATQSQLAARLGWAESYVSSIMAGLSLSTARREQLDRLLKRLAK